MNDYTTYSDEKLLALLRENKPTCDHAFYVLYNRYSIKLNTFCLFYTPNKESAEDVFQETWIRFDRTVKGGKNIRNVLAFLVTISRNMTIDMHRRKSTDKTVQAENIENFSTEEIPGYLQFDEALEQEELISLVKIAANSLEEKYKETFVLKRFCDLSYKEIAAITGNTVNSVKKRSSRAMEMIKELLKPYIKELS